LYFDELRGDPAAPQAPDRDRFVLPKGHCALGLYVVLAMRGYFPEAELTTFDQGGSRLQMHPDMLKLPGVEMSTGSLGQGLSAGIGMALGARLGGPDSSPTSRIFVLLGDGELQEGMVWEALHLAPRYGLGRLTAILDHNRLQQYGWPPSEDGTSDRRDPWAGTDLAATVRGLGWTVVEIDGNDIAEIRSALAGARDTDPRGRPTMVLARTRKGAGCRSWKGRPGGTPAPPMTTSWPGPSPSCGSPTQTTGACHDRRDAGGVEQHARRARRARPGTRGARR
jgi:transketolase